MASAKSMEANFSFPGFCLDQKTITPDTQLDEPPVYIGPQSSSKPRSPLPVVLTSNVDFRSYSIPASTVSGDNTTRIVIDAELNSRAETLYNLLQQQIALPPKPVVHIRGTHTDYLYSWGTTRTDFDLTLDIMPLIVSVSGRQHSHIDIKPIPENEGASDALRWWVEKFCNGSTENESFLLERSVANWDTKFLQSRIRGAVQSTKYDDNLEITFPITNSRLLVVKTRHDQECGSLVERPSKASWRNVPKGPSQVPSKFTDELPHAPCLVRVVWPYALTRHDNGPSQSQTSDAYATSRCAIIQSEQDWWKVWEQPIRNSVLGRKQGWVTVEDWKDMILDQVQYQDPQRSWGNKADDRLTLWKGLKMGGSKKPSPANLLWGLKVANRAGF